MTDYIKRDDAIDAIGEAVADGLPKGWYSPLTLIPSEDVTPVRHGQWVESFKVNAPPTLRSRWTCSWCGNVQTYGATDYCPNCGARMDGESDEID